jgi:hypothetical protein
MADGIRATPYRYASAGAANDIIGGLLGYLRDPRRTQQMQGLAGLLESTGIPKTVERLAYGEPLTNLQQANVPALRPETAEALLTLLPVPSGASRAARAADPLVQRYGPKLETAMEPMLASAYNRGGLTREMVEAMGTNTQSKMFVPASDKEAFAANKMLKAGSPKEKVWSEIGVVRGPDGEWRKEISDESARISQAKLPETYIEGAGYVPSWKLEQALIHPELYKEMPDLAKIQGSFRTGDRALATYNPGMDWISYQKQAYQKGFLTKNQEDKILKAKKELDDFYKNKDFIKYEEKLEQAFNKNENIENILNLDIEKKRNQLSENYYGQLRKLQEAEDQGSTLGTGQSARGTTLHEVQHAIQERGGFAVGGSPEQFRDQAKAIEARDVLGWTKELRRKAQEMPGADTIAIDAALRKEYEALGVPDWIPSTEIRQKALQPSLLYPEKYDGKEALQMQQLVELYGLDKRTEPLSADDVYKNLMGEAEARLTERRMNLTPEQRKQYFPFEYTGREGYGLDVKPEDLLYFNEKGQFIQRGLLE